MFRIFWLYKLTIWQSAQKPNEIIQNNFWMIPQTIVIRKKQDVDAKIAKVKNPQQFKKTMWATGTKKGNFFWLA